jgi:hypothetical protein
VYAASSTLDNVRVASLEHLLLLKLAAYEDQRGSAKGRKDERDIVRISHLLMRRALHRDWLAPYVNPVDVDLLKNLSRSSEIASLSSTPKQAAALRAELGKLVAVLQPLVSS